MRKQKTQKPRVTFYPELWAIDVLGVLPTTHGINRVLAHFAELVRLRTDKLSRVLTPEDWTFLLHVCEDLAFDGPAPWESPIEGVQETVDSYANSEEAFGLVWSKDGRKHFGRLVKKLAGLDDLDAVAICLAVAYGAAQSCDDPEGAKWWEIKHRVARRKRERSERRG